MAYLQKSPYPIIATNRICRLETTNTHFKFGYDDLKRKEKRKFHQSQPSRYHAFVDELTPNQKLITRHLGEVKFKSSEYINGQQILEVLVKGTAGYRRETIFPLHVISC